MVRVQEPWLEHALILQLFWLPNLYLVLLAISFRGVILNLFRAILIAAYAEVNDTHVPPTDILKGPPLSQTRIVRAIKNRI